MRARTTSSPRARRRSPMRTGRLGQGHLEPVFHLRPDQVHRLLALRARLRGGAGHLRADDHRPRLRFARRAGPDRELPRFGMRVLRRLRAGLPDRDADGETASSRWASRSIRVTTCAYCGVGCSFKAEMQGDKVVRMVPYKDGKANEAIPASRAASPGAMRPTRTASLKPMIREKITDPWREVSWEEAINLRPRIQAHPGPNMAANRIGGITSSRCTNEEVFLVQKLVRAGFRNNNVDTCARVCHSPTGYGLKTTFGTSAGTQDFESVEGRCRPGHRRQPDRRPSGLRLAHEEAPAPGRQADRRRSAPDRPRQVAHIEGGLPSAS
jgi:hypothetical protein